MWRLRLPGRIQLRVTGGRRGGAALAVLGLAIFLWVRVRFPVCSTEPFVCSDGRHVVRSGYLCRGNCTRPVGLPWEVNGSTAAVGRLYTLVMWNAPLHSWSGVAAEAVNFIVPLKQGPLPNLALVGPHEHDYVSEMPIKEQEILETARDVGHAIATNATTLCKKFPDRSPLHPLPRNATLASLHRLSAIYITQYDPGTYEDDLYRYCGGAFDYRIGRAMFETTGIPNGWVERMAHMDEVWVPSRWGLSRFAAAGVPLSKLMVMPQAVDTSVFDPSRVQRLDKLMRGAADRFAFLSVFKWEERKNYRGLVTAFMQEFSSKDMVKLFLRAGRQEDVDRFVKDAADALGIKDHAPVVWVHQQPAERYPKLFKMADAFVLPTHGEGWGRPVMEAMAMELPCIVTHWSGLTDLVDESTAVLLPPGKMVPAYADQHDMFNFGDQGSHHWASVPLDPLRKAMRYVSRPQSRAVVRAIGKRARKRIIRHFSREVVAERVMKRLREIQEGLSDERQSAADKKSL
eukprot:m.204452 g.204452  ORF g.204452 m.204452 type:complete len:515 (-) comp22520_c0_seq1:158-1702(-)